MEQETDHIVKSIQSLFKILKNPNPNESELDSSLTTIARIVSAMLDTCEHSVKSVNGDSCDEIFILLESNLDRLLFLGETIKIEVGNKNVKQQIASTAYDIAKAVKRLIEII